MQHEKSCGALVVRRADDGKLYILMIRHKAGGHRSFPKGHMEAGESEHETALREVKEETGLDVTFVDDFRIKDEHNLAREGRPNTIKQTIYFLAYYEDQTFVPQESEISQIVLLDYEAAMTTLQFDSFKRILTQAHDFLEKKRC